MNIVLMFDYNDNIILFKNHREKNNFVFSFIISILPI